MLKVMESTMLAEQSKTTPVPAREFGRGFNQFQVIQQKKYVSTGCATHPHVYSLLHPLHGGHVKEAWGYDTNYGSSYSVSY